MSWQTFFDTFKQNYANCFQLSEANRLMAPTSYLLYRHESGIDLLIDLTFQTRAFNMFCDYAAKNVSPSLQIPFFFALCPPQLSSSSSSSSVHLATLVKCWISAPHHCTDSQLAGPCGSPQTLYSYALGSKWFRTLAWLSVSTVPEPITMVGVWIL